MNDNRIYGILANALGTIEMQRQEIATLRPAAEGYLRLSQLLDLACGTSNRGERAYGVDVSWEIKSAMEEIHAGMQREKDRARAQAMQADNARAQAGEGAEGRVLRAEMPTFEEFNREECEREQAGEGSENQVLRAGLYPATAREPGGYYDAGVDRSGERVSIQDAERTD